MLHLLGNDRGMDGASRQGQDIREAPLKPGAKIRPEIAAGSPCCTSARRGSRAVTASLLCTCGHDHKAHSHYRRGSECAVCVCPEWRAENWLRRMLSRW